MKYIDAEKLIAVLERQNADKNIIQPLIRIIDSLQQEQPNLPGIEENGIPGKDFIPVEWVDTCEKYGKWKIAKVEQPDVEEEIEDYWKAHGPMSHAEYDRLAKCARHFYELGRQAKPEVFDSVAFQKGVQEGRRLEREDVKSIIQSRIDEILGDAQPAPTLRIELQELIKKIEA